MGISAHALLATCNQLAWQIITLSVMALRPSNLTETSKERPPSSRAQPPRPRVHVGSSVTPYSEAVQTLWPTQDLQIDKGTT